MENDLKEKYVRAIAIAVELAMGQRNDDYNKGGIGLRDYWSMNGIRSPLQMVDMKLKRAMSQVGSWDDEQMGPLMPIPTRKQQVEKMMESMVDLINYAAFVAMEAWSLAEDHTVLNGKTQPDFGEKGLWTELHNAVGKWQARQEKKNEG